MDFDAMIDEARSALAEKRQLKALIEGEITDLEAEIHGLELAKVRRDPVRDLQIVPDSKDSDWATLTRAKAIGRVLEAQPRLGPAAIARALVERGRSDTDHKVSMALGDMKRRGFAMNENGKWWLTAHGTDELAS